MKRKTHYTSQAALLATGAELSRRGYDVAFTLGNTPRIDRICGVPDGTPFKIQVKGITWESGFRVQKAFFDQARQDDLFLIVVRVPPPGEEKRFRYFVLSHHEASETYSEAAKKWKPTVD